MARSIVLKNMLWKIAERGGVQLVQFLAQMLLVRILSPNDYGTLAIVLVFINLATIFVNCGLPTALIQKKEITSKDISTVFFASLAIAVSFIIIIWIIAPFIADFYGDQHITNYLRVASFVLIIGAFNAVQGALIARKLAFKKNFFSSLGGIVVAAVVGLVMAYNGFGVWALVAHYAVNIFVASLILYFIHPWFPSWTFSSQSFRGLFAFGSKLLGANLLSALFTDLYALIIGKRYSRVWLGYYENGNRIPATASNSLTMAVQSVLLPVLSGSQDNLVRLKQMMRQSVQISSMVLFPMMAILGVCAKPIVVILMTEKWLFAVPFLQLAAILYAFYPIHSVNLQAINAVGRSDVYLKCEMQKKGAELLILAITIWFNIYIMAIGRVVASLVALYINMRPNREFVLYGFREQISDLLTALVLTIISFGLVVPLSYLGFSNWLTLIMQSAIGTSIYLLLSWKFNRNAVQYLISKIRK